MCFDVARGVEVPVIKLAIANTAVLYLKRVDGRAYGLATLPTETPVNHLDNIDLEAIDLERNSLGDYVQTMNFVFALRTNIPMNIDFRIEAHVPFVSTVP